MNITLKRKIVSLSRPVLCMLTGLVLSSNAVADEEAPSLVFKPLDSSETIQMQNKATPVFTEGYKPGTEALLLTDRESPASGAFFRLKTAMLESAGVEIRFYTEEESLGKGTLVNMGGSGNTKVKLELRNRKIRGTIYGREKSIMIEGPEIESRRWYHVALTWSLEQGTRLYLDGELVAEDPQPFTFWGKGGTDVVSLGDNPDYRQLDGSGYYFYANDNNFIGKLMEFRIGTLDNIQISGGTTSIPSANSGEYRP